MRIIALLCLVLAAPATYANYNAYRCDYCSEPAMKAAVEAAELTGIAYAYDLHNGVVRKYDVTREDIVFGQWTYFAWPAQVEPWVVDAISLLSEFHHHTNGTLKVTGWVDADGSIGHLSAWDLYQGANRDAVATYVDNVFNHSFGSASWMVLAGVVEMLASLFSDRIPAMATVTVTFSDQSTANVIMDMWAKTSEVDPESIRDSDGNRIPFSPADLNGANWDYSGGGSYTGANLERALQRFAQMGISVGGTRWACVCTSSCSCQTY